MLPRAFGARRAFDDIILWQKICPRLAGGANAREEPEFSFIVVQYSLRE